MSKIELFSRQLINAIRVDKSMPMSSISGDVRLSIALAIDFTMQHVRRINLWAGLMDRLPVTYYV